MTRLLRQHFKDHTLDEMVIVEKGPLSDYSETILVAAMNECGKEHTTNEKLPFMFNTEYITSYTGGANKVM